MSRQVLITGGAGFVGSHLADELLRLGHRVRVLDELNLQVHPAGRPDYLSRGVELIVGDVRDPNRLRQALDGVHVIFHFAAAVGVGQSMYEIARYVSINTQGTAELLQAILDMRAPIEKLVTASSMSIYGEGRYLCPSCMREIHPPVRSLQQLKAALWNPGCDQCGTTLKPVPTAEDKPSVINSIYALTKRDQEEMCLIYGRAYDLPVTALRFFNIYGTRQALSNPYTGVAAVFASRMLNGNPPLIFEDGEQMRDFVSVHDVVQACVLAMERGRSDGEVINIGSGTPIPISRVAELLGQVLERHMPPVVTNQFRSGDIRHCYADIGKARRLLGYQPRVTHEDGFAELATWLRGQQPEDKAETMLRELTAYGLTA
jgi:dTDP-L-rhamnose 4-epimerase